MSGFCQAVVFLSYCCSFLSVWIVVSFTVERFIAICFPNHQPDMGSIRRAQYVIAGLCGSSLLIYGVSIFTTGVQEHNGNFSCMPVMKYNTINTVLAYGDTIITLLLPFVIIVILNVTIAFKISRFMNKREGCIQIEATDSSASSVIETGTGYRKQPSQQNHHANKICSSAQIKITKSLLVISSIFILINLPSYVVRIRVIVLSLIHTDPDDFPYHYLIQQIFQVIYYTNFAINFPLYSLSSSIFREAFGRVWWQFKFKLSKMIEPKERDFINMTHHKSASDPNVNPRQYVAKYVFDGGHAKQTPC